MDKCPYCSAETRPGDNFCLNCGNRLVPSTPSPQQAQPALGDTTLPTAEDWVPPAPQAPAPGSPWSDPDLLTIASTSAGISRCVAPKVRSGTAPVAAMPVPAGANDSAGAFG